MTHAHTRPTPSDLVALAARVQLWVATLVVWLVRALGDGPMAAPARCWAHGALAFAERGVGAIIVLLALRRLGAPPPAPASRGRRPRRAPRGFAWADARGGDMRHVTRPLFRRERDLLRRARRLAAIVDAIDALARCLARRIARVPPTMRLVALAPPACRVAPCVTALQPGTDDTS